MNINIYQTAYDTTSKANVSPFAIEHWLDNDRPELYEYQAYLKLLHEKSYQECDYIGLLSTKFTPKTRLSVLEVIGYIQKNPGYDIYTFNPFPYISYLFFNQWEHGEQYHPGIKELAQKISDEFQIGNINSAPRVNSFDSLYCNFWIGTSEFFKTYVEFLSSVIAFMLGSREMFLGKTLHRGEINAPFLTFILERIFSHYVINHKNKINRFSYLYPENLEEFMIDDLPPKDLEMTRMKLKVVCPLIRDLDNNYVNQDDSRDIHFLKFQKINQYAVELINNCNNPSKLLEKISCIHAEGNLDTLIKLAS